MRRTLAIASCLLSAGCTHVTAMSNPPATDDIITRILVQAAGSTPATTAAFTATDQWALTYTFDCHGQPDVQFQIADSDGTAMITNISQQHGGGGQGPEPTGTHQLTVTSHCAWTLTATQTGVPTQG